MSATPTTPGLERLGRRLERLAAVGHPAGAAHAADRLASALAQGTAPHLALAQASASPELVSYVERANAPDLEGLLERVAPSLARAEGRAAELRNLTGYVWLLTACTVAIGAIVWGGVVPAMELVARAGRDMTADVAVVSAPAAVAYLVALGLLAGLGVALSVRRPVFPFRAGRTVVERALLLGAAAAAARSGAELPAALKAAAALCRDPALRRDAEEVAAGLARGASAGEGLALGALGAPLFFAAAEHGAGRETLEALADFEESAASGAWTSEVIKAQLLSVALGGLALACAGAMHLAVYSRGLVR